MQRSRLLLLPVLVAAAFGPGAALADDPPEFNSKCGELDCRIERTQARWQLLSVDEGLSLQLTYQYGGCRLGNPSYKLTETASRIRIAVQQDEVVAIDQPDPRPICSAELRYGTFSIELKRPVGGRRIFGGPRVGVHSRDPFPGPAPEVADLAKHDALIALHFQGFRVRTIGRRSGAVAFQSPLPGKVPRDGKVRLTIGRNLFPARRIKGCLERAGQVVRLGRPKPGDLDAPDLELRLYHPGLWAFVALYADPVRAKELAPTLRRNARRVHGTFERHGHTSIIWLEPPQPEVAARIRSCAF